MNIIFKDPYMLLLVIPVVFYISLLYWKTSNHRRILSRTLGFKNSRRILLFNILKILVPVIIVVALANPVLIIEDKIMVRSVSDAFKHSSRLPVQFIILIDVSPSMHRDNYLGEAVNVVKEILGLLNNTDKVVIAVFGGYVEKIYDGTPGNASKILPNILSYEIKYTSIDNAVSWGYSYGKASHIPSAIIIVSDGADNYGGDPVETVKAVNESGTPVLFVKIGDDPRGVDLYSKLSLMGFKVVEPGGISEELLRNLLMSVITEARLNAYKARGISYITIRVEDYTPTISSLLIATILLVLTRLEGR